MPHGMFSIKCPFHVFMAGTVSTIAIGMIYWKLTNQSKKIRRFSDPTHLLSNSLKISETTVLNNSLVFISGQVGEDGDIGTQTRAALASVDKALELAGTDKSKILEMTIWLKDIATDYKDMNEVYNEWVSSENPPCRATVEARLYSPECLVEIRVIAAK